LLDCSAQTRIERNESGKHILAAEGVDAVGVAKLHCLAEKFVSAIAHRLHGGDNLRRDRQALPILVTIAPIEPFQECQAKFGRQVTSEQPFQKRKLSCLSAPSACDLSSFGRMQTGSNDFAVDRGAVDLTHRRGKLDTEFFRQLGDALKYLRSLFRVGLHVMFVL
jgi:hypothetical protein